MNAPIWTTALPDWEERIVAGESLVPCEPLFKQSAEIALKVFKALKLVDVIGKPEIVQVTRQWVYDFVAAVFGAYDPVAKKRLIKEFFLLISKKNTKSTLAAAIMMTALILNERESCELAIIAPTKEVAGNSFNPMRDMIREDPDLKAMFNVSEHTKTITHRGTNATLKVVAAENDSAAGIKATYVLIDELWVFGKRANAAAMLQEATGGLISRPEGFVISLTTMSDEAPAGVMKEKLDYARGVRDGEIIDPRFLGVLYEFPQKYIEDGSYILPENWYITNPNLGASVGLEELADILRKAGESHDKNTLQTALAKHLNIPIGISLRANRWAGAEFWEAASDKTITLDDIIAHSEVVTMGGDGGGLDDLLGGSVLGRLPIVIGHEMDEITRERRPIKPWKVWTHAWCHPIALERRKQDEPRYRDFEKDGDLTVVEYVGQDTEQFADIAVKIYKANKLDRVGLDPLMVGDLVDDLIAAGIPEDKIVGVPQGFKISGYQKTAERRIASKYMTHSGQRMMDWCVGNARVLMKGSGTMLSKAESGTGKIDPLIALLNAVALMSENPAPPTDKSQVQVFF